MSTATTQRQYDELIADHYDLDPQSVNGATRDCALQQLADSACLESSSIEGQQDPMSVLDLGMGTGLFFDRLLAESDREILPFGLDISDRMLEVARRRIPRLRSAVDDAANLDRHFCETSFDLICTHLITGFVPLEILAPKIWDKLAPGGYWSFVGATSSAFPELQRKASSRLIQMLLGNKKIEFTGLITPDDQQEVEDIAEANAFEIPAAQTIKPQISFSNFDEFMDFSYHGGWLTPFVEELGLQNIRPTLRVFLNTFVFPIRDHHTVVVALMRKPAEL